MSSTTSAAATAGFRLPPPRAARAGSASTSIRSRIAESQANAKAAGVESCVEFRLQDAMTVDVSPATVVTLYLLSSSNAKLRPILTRQLKPGLADRLARLQHGTRLAGRQDRQFISARGDEVTLYLWKTDGTPR